MVEASWQPDPGGGHELRYWDGAAWTEHVSDGGVTASATAPPDLPPPPPPVAPPPPPPSPAAAGWAPPDPGSALPAAAPAPAPGGKVGWKDRLKQVADHTAEVIGELIGTWRGEGRAVMVATHDLESAARDYDLVLALNRRAIAFGPAAEVISEAVLRETFSGHVVRLADGGLIDTSHHHHGAS